METKKEYMAPKVVIQEFRMEVGYSGSMRENIIFWETEETRQVEDYQQHSDWNDGSSFWN